MSRDFRVNGPQSSMLIVEGADDFHFCLSLLMHHKLAWKVPNNREKLEGKFGLELGGGYPDILKEIQLRITDVDLKYLGIIVDADEDIVDRWVSLRNALTSFGYKSVPETPDPQGTIITDPDKATIGIWIMPDNKLPGALEDFVRLLIPNHGEWLWSHAQASVDAIPTAKRPFPDNDNTIMKAYLHTWLAWQEEPGKPIGQAITKKFLSADSIHARKLILWMQRLFNLDVER